MGKLSNNKLREYEKYNTYSSAKWLILKNLHSKNSNVTNNMHKMMKRSMKDTKNSQHIHMLNCTTRHTNCSECMSRKDRRRAGSV